MNLAGTWRLERIECKMFSFQLAMLLALALAGVVVTQLLLIDVLGLGRTLKGMNGCLGIWDRVCAALVQFSQRFA